MAATDKAPIIIKRKSGGGEEGHHGGAWKVAYADFVTAMMAFFLLMWLLNATTEDQRKGIADYFDPAIPISRVSGGGSGALGGDTLMSQETRAFSGSGGTGQGARGSGQSITPPGVPAAPKPQDPLLTDGLEALQASLQAMAEAADQDGDLAEHMRVRVTADGLVIELVDTGDKALFARGATTPSPRLERLLDVIASTLSIATNDVAITGHTDAAAFSAGGTYSNWELSTDRAHAARRALIAKGLESGRFATVAGAADTAPLSEDPYAPENRRIAITLLKNKPL
ncbi:MAG: flagellar motor protein MotB [Pseudomonadota bacterium]